MELSEDEQKTIHRVFAFDSDEGENATVSYLMPAGAERQTRFSVDAQTGEIKCSKTLFEGETFTLMVRLGSLFVSIHCMYCNVMHF